MLNPPLVISLSMQEEALLKKYITIDRIKKLSLEEKEIQTKIDEYNSQDGDLPPMTTDMLAQHTYKLVDDLYINESPYLTKEEKGDSKSDDSFTASSAEGKALDIELTYTYQYKPENVAEVFVRFKGQSGTEVKDSFIKPNIISWSKEVIAKYNVADILGAEKANVKQIRLHDFRHSCASLLVNNQAPITVVSSFMGHSNTTETLKTYSHLFKGKLNETMDIINNLNK